MSGGGNYKHVFKVNYNKVVAYDRWKTEYASPYTHIFMPIIRSFPVTANIRDPPIIFRRITSAPVCVKFVGHKTYKFRPMISNQPLNYATRNIEAMIQDNNNIIWQTVTNNGEQLVKSKVIGTCPILPVPEDFDNLTLNPESIEAEVQG